MTFQIYIIWRMGKMENINDNYKLKIKWHQQFHIRPDLQKKF